MFYIVIRGQANIGGTSKEGDLAKEVFSSQIMIVPDSLYVDKTHLYEAIYNMFLLYGLFCVNGVEYES